MANAVQVPAPNPSLWSKLLRLRFSTEPACSRGANIEKCTVHDFNLAIKNKGCPPKPWRWEIYTAGKSKPVRQSEFFETMSEALIKTRDAKGKATRCLIYLGSDWPNNLPTKGETLTRHINAWPMSLPHIEEVIDSNGQYLDIAIAGRKNVAGESKACGNG
jgi:hypothetical protein